MWLKCLCLLCLLSVSVATGELCAQTRNNILFGKEAIPYPLLPGEFSKWDEMLAQWQQRQGFKKEKCAAACFPCACSMTCKILYNNFRVQMRGGKYKKSTLS